MKEVPNRKTKLMGSVSVSRATDGTPPRREAKMKLSTISQIVEAILAQTKSGIKLPHEDVREATFKRMANEATIILKTAMICESNGIDEALFVFHRAWQTVYTVIGNIHENKDLLEYIEKDQKTE